MMSRIGLLRNCAGKSNSISAASGSVSLYAENGTVYERRFDPENTNPSAVIVPPLL